MVSYERNFIYIHIPKTAGTSVERFLCESQTMPIDKYRQFLPGCGDGRQHFFFNEVLQHPDFSGSRSEFFCFTIVRNPWDWFLSLVHYWVRRGFLEGHEDDLKTNFFHLLHLDRIDNHRLGSQSRYIFDDKGERVDYIARFETLDHDFDIIREVIGLPSEPPLPRFNIAPGARRPYVDAYDREMADAIAQRFSDDIETFGYSFGGGAAAG